VQQPSPGPGSVASNRVALGALALVVAGVTALPTAILRAGERAEVQVRS
jgi:hypothetical protein